MTNRIKLLLTEVLRNWMVVLSQTFAVEPIVVHRAVADVPSSTLVPCGACQTGATVFARLWSTSFADYK